MSAHSNLTEISSALDLVWRNNITASKLSLGLAFYGRSTTLASSSCADPECLYLSGGDKGRCSNQTGVLINSEIDQIILNNKLTPKLWEDAAVKTITWGDDQWVSFDDKDTFKLEGDFAKSHCFGGVLVWAVTHDDYLGSYGTDLSVALGRAVVDKKTGVSTGITNRAVSHKNHDKGQAKYCKWANCGETCPDEFKTVKREDKPNEIMLNAQTCSGYGSSSVFCCPDDDVPQCRWNGFENSGKCRIGCDADQAQVGATDAGCTKSGWQSACCTVYRVDQALLRVQVADGLLQRQKRLSV